MTPPRARTAGTLAWLGEPRGFAGVLLVYLALHVLLRLVVSDSLTIDDAREAVYGQTLEWGYQPRQPPLYNWAVWAAFQGLGVSVLALTVVKYAFLGLAYAFVYAGARRVLADDRLAALASLSLWLVLPVSWTVHEALTHSVAGLAACAATFHALLRLEARGSLAAYVAFGAALGLGVLSKFSYGVFAAALVVAALTLDRFRARLLHPGTLVALGVAGAIALPYARWYAGHDFDFVRMYATEVRRDLGGSFLGSAAGGLYYVVRITLYYVTPLAVVFLLLFPEVYRRRPALPGGASGPRRLVTRFHATVLALLAGGALAGALAYLKFRWLIPGFFLVPLLAFARLGPTPPDARRLRRYALVLLVAELGVVAGIALRVYAGHRVTRAYKLNTPYPEVAARLVAAGFRRGTIVAGLGPLAGNLRLHFPASRVVSLEGPHYVPPAPGGGQCLVAWERGDAVPGDLAALLAARFGIPSAAGVPVQVVEARYRFDDDRLRVHFVLWPAGAGTCQ